MRLWGRLVEEAGEREQHGHGEVLRDDPHAHLAGQAGQLRRLPQQQQQQQVLGEDICRRERGSEDEEHDPGALQREGLRVRIEEKHDKGIRSCKSK